jgi:PilZ domain-containing protein
VIEDELPVCAELDLARNDTKREVQPCDIQRKPDRRNNENRRQHTRHFITAEAEIVEQRSRVRISGRASDLSGGGCYVDSVSCLPVGAAVYLRLSRSGAATFQCKAMITYSLPSMGMGIKFTDVAEDQATILSKWIAELSGESVAEPQIESEEIGSIFGLERQPAMDGPSGWREAVADLIKLLTKKQVLTDKEVADLRRKLLA